MNGQHMSEFSVAVPRARKRDKKCATCDNMVRDNRAKYCPVCGEKKIAERHEYNRERAARRYQRIKQMKAASENF